VQEGLDALRDVIWHIESFDTTTVRASTPMYLMARRIRATGVKMVLSGEGSDEIFGGYLYFHKAPNPRAFHEELVRKLHLLHLYDCLRANKSMAAWGIEARVPFLDTRFLDVAMRVPARLKMVEAGGIEKKILREAFRGALPDEILWRQKEQFSDGVGYSWIDSLKAFAEARVTDRELAEARVRFPVGTPATKESLPLPLDLRRAVPAPLRGGLCSLGAERRMLLSPRRSSGIRRSRRSPIPAGARCERRAPGRAVDPSRRDALLSPDRSSGGTHMQARSWIPLAGIAARIAFRPPLAAETGGDAGRRLSGRRARRMLRATARRAGVARQGQDHQSRHMEIGLAEGTIAPSSARSGSMLGLYFEGRGGYVYRTRDPADRPRWWRIFRECRTCCARWTIACRTISSSS
jgi:hypothetical protein